MMHHIEHNQAFPSHDELLPHLHAEYRHRQMSIEALDADIAVGWRHLKTCEYKQNARPHNVKYDD